MSTAAPSPRWPTTSCWLPGVGLMHELKLNSFARSRQLIEEALARAPRAAEAHAWLAEWYVMAVFNGWSTDRARDTGMARECTARALDIEPENTFCLTIDGVVNNNLMQRMDKAESRFGAALERNPNESMAWLLSGVLLAYRDDGTAAVSRVETALRLSPLDPFGYFFEFARRHRLSLGRGFHPRARLRRPLAGAQRPSRLDAPGPDLRAAFPRPPGRGPRLGGGTDAAPAGVHRRGLSPQSPGRRVSRRPQCRGGAGRRRNSMRE